MRIRILLLTSSGHKAEEARSILEAFRKGAFEVEVARGVRKLEIQSESLEEIALTALATALKDVDESGWHSIMAEDSGLFVEALHGFPGPYSSYVLAKIGLEGILKLLRGVENRRACYRAAVAYTVDGALRTARGELCGTISEEPRGSWGFGYDPIFIPEGYGKTLAELGPEVKNSISHRARALMAAAEEILASVCRKERRDRSGEREVCG